MSIGSIKGYTKFYKLIIPRFDLATWHDFIETNFRTIDALLYNTFAIAGFKGMWENSTTYEVGDVLFIGNDNTDWEGRLVKVLSNHTTPATGTFEDYYDSNQDKYDTEIDVGAAEEFAKLAKDWAIKTDGTVADGEYSSKYYAQQSSSYATNSYNSATSAETYKNNAKVWAEGTDEEVQSLGGTHSAKSWAQGINLSLSDLGETDINSPTAGQFLMFNNDGFWTNTDSTASVAWGGITGTLASQTDLKNALDAKADAADLGTMAAETASDYYTKTATDTLLSVKADDSTVVHLSSDESITGRKNFVGGYNNIKLSLGVGDTYTDIAFYNNDNTTRYGYIRANNLGDISLNATTSISILPQTTHYNKINQQYKQPLCDQIHTSLKKGTSPNMSSDLPYGGMRFKDKDNAILGDLLFFYNSSKQTGVSLRAYKANNSADSSIAAFTMSYPASGSPLISAGGILRPDSDNTYDLGAGSYRWKQLYAGTTTISTSDERLKQNIESIPEEVLEAWGEVEYYRFKYKDAVEEKGENARYHTGLVAQRILTVFNNHNLDATEYGLLCYDEWEAQDAVYDENGNILIPAVEAGNRYSLRYEECLCIEAVYQRYRADKLEQRLQTVENLLNINNQGEN